MKRYELIETLGRGSMGSVHRAQDRLTGEYVALKRVEMGSFEDIEHREALAREFQTLSGLRHPNIVRVLNYGFDRLQQPYFTMALLHNHADFNTAAQNRDFFGKIDLIAQVLQALAYLHRQGILHRDLKPSNVLITTDGRAHVLDFGLATSIDADHNHAMGTVLYMAPEVLRGETSTPAADLFAIGVMLYEILSGTHPFDSTTVNETINRVLLTEPDLQPIQQQVAAALATATSPTAPYHVLRPAEPYTHTPDTDTSPAARAERFVAVLKRLLAKHPGERDLEAYDVLDMLCEALNIATLRESAAVRYGFLRAARFVGREYELRRLDAALHALENGGLGSNWLVAGESGVGKTRLLEEVRVQALVRGVQVAAGRAKEDSTSEFALSRGFLPPLLLAVGVAAHEARDLKHLVPEIDRIVGYAVEQPSEPFSMVAFRVQALILELLKRLERPTLLILEDLQWMGFEGGLIREITALAPTLPLLVVGSYRTDEAPYLYGNLHRSEQILLERFTRAELAALSRSMLGKSGTSESVVDMLERESEGNITFAIEILQDLSARTRRLDDLDDDDLPHDVYTQGIMELAQRRVSRLPLDYQPLMRLAAVAGREVNFDVLRHYDHVVKFPLWINAGMNAAILTNTDGKWQFAHDKLREGILRGLMPEERARLNRMVADALRALHLEKPAANDTQTVQQTLDTLPAAVDLAARITRHYLAAGEWNAAAATLFDTVNAHLHTKLPLATLVPLADEALARVPKSARHARMVLLHTRGLLHIGAHELTQRLAAWETALQLANELQDATHQIELNLLIARTHLHSSNFNKAHHYGHSAYQRAITTNDRYRLARALYFMAEMCSSDGRYADAVSFYQQSLDVYHQLGIEVGYYTALGNIAEAQLALGEFEASLRNSQQAIQHFKAHGFALKLGFTYLRAIQANLQLHRYAAARETLQTALQLNEALDDNHLADYLAHYQALLALREGEVAESARIFTALESNPRADWQAADRFHLLMYAPLAYALLPDTTAVLRVLRVLAATVDAELVRPASEYRLYLLLGLAALAFADQNTQLTAMALGSILHSGYSTGEMREHTRWAVAQFGLDADTLSNTEMSSASVMTALRARYDV